MRSTIAPWRRMLLAAALAGVAGFGAGAEAAPPTAAPPAGEAPAPSRQIVITVDDIPGRLEQPTLRGFQEINRKIVAALAKEKVPAIAFVNERFLQVPGERDARTDLLRVWLDGGMSLGNHLYRHRSLSRTPLAQYQDDVIRGEVLTRQVLAERKLPLVYFRHPFLHTGPTAEVKAGFEKFLAERGYKVAPGTFDHSDWVFTRVFEEARARKDRALEQRTRAAFLGYFEQQVAYFEQVSTDLFRREIPQILVTHANRINAELMPEWLAILRRRGYRFVTLDQALADPAYASPDGYVGPDGISWFHRWARGLKRTLQTPGEPEVPADIQSRYDAIAARAPEQNE